MDIAGRTAIITGASSGIGQAVAAEFAGRGANVVLAARSRDKLNRLAADLAPLPGRALVVATDVTESLAVEALVRKTAEEFGSVDILINNAGVGLFAPIADGNVENARYLFEVNFWGALHCIQAATPYMLDQGSGHIVNVSSVAGHIVAALHGHVRRHEARAGRGLRRPPRRAGRDGRRRQHDLPRPDGYVVHGEHAAGGGGAADPADRALRRRKRRRAAHLPGGPLGPARRLRLSGGRRRS